MDNLEQLLTEPGIEVLAELLANAPQVKLLATSRESLGLQDEWVFEVQGLPIPESTVRGGSAENTSVELFLQRARRAYVGFQRDARGLPGDCSHLPAGGGESAGDRTGRGLGADSFL